MEAIKEKKFFEVKHLKTSFFTTAGEVKAVDDISYYVDAGEVVALVGESGCGKSVSQMSVMQLVQSPPGKIIGGEVLLEGGKPACLQIAFKGNATHTRRKDFHDLSGAHDKPQPCIDHRVTIV